MEITCWSGIFDWRLLSCCLSICSDNRFATSLTSSANFDSTLLPSTLPFPPPFIAAVLRSDTSFLLIAARPPPPTWVSSSSAPVSPLRAPLSLPSASLNSLKPLSNCFQAISEVVRPSRRLVILKLCGWKGGFIAMNKLYFDYRNVSNICENERTMYVYISDIPQWQHHIFI